ncbi:MAG TPA: hypothetical protein VIK55_12835 [Paludibacter sp.]|nr:hypothetical protein [Prolixibacteraceae bacterium]
MILNVLIYFAVAVGLALAKTYGTEYIKFYFANRKNKSIEKPTYTIIQNITTINNFNNTQELPK